jgi:hypothetical protein
VATSLQDAVEVLLGRDRVTFSGPGQRGETGGAPETSPEEVMSR